MRSLHQNAGSQPLRNEFGDPRALGAGSPGWAGRYTASNTRRVDQTDGPPGQGITSYIRRTVTVQEIRSGRGFNNRGNPDSTTGQTSGVPVTPGQIWTGAVWCRVNSAAAVQMAFAGRWYNAEGTQLGGFNFALATPANNVWTRLIGTAKAPANAAYMNLYTISTAASAGMWEVGETLDCTGAMLVPGIYTGLHCDGFTPGWRFDSGTSGPSAGLPYTLPSLVGMPIFQTETVGLATLPQTNADPLAGYSLYAVYDALNNDGTGSGASAQMIAAIGELATHNAISQNGTAEVRAQLLQSSVETYFRLHQNGSSAPSGGYSNSYPTARSLGRHGVSAVVTPTGPGAATRRHVFDGGSATTPTALVWDTGLKMLRADLGSAANRSAPVAMFVWDRPHTIDEQAAVHRWLAARYGYALGA